MKIPTTLDRKNMKKGLKSPASASVLALLLVLCSLPVYADEQQIEQTETPTVDGRLATIEIYVIAGEIDFPD